MKIDIFSATHDTFRSYIGQEFAVDTEGGSVTLTLDNVKIFEGSTVRDNHIEIDGVVYPSRQGFALTFLGPAEPEMPADTRVLKHPEIGELSLYLSPFRRDHNCMLYESVFN